MLLHVADPDLVELFLVAVCIHDDFLLQLLGGEQDLVNDLLIIPELVQVGVRDLERDLLNIVVE